MPSSLDSKTADALPAHVDASNYRDFDKQVPLSLWLVFKRSACYEFNFLRYQPWDYVMLLWLPLLTIVCVWWTFSNPYIANIPIGVIDQSGSEYSQTLTRYLQASPDVDIEAFYPNINMAEEAILDMRIHGVLIIPRDFADNINQGRPAPLLFKVNTQYGTHSGMAQRGVQTVVGTISAGVEMQRQIKQGASPSTVQVSYSPIGIERISLFNAGTNYQQFLASTVIPALLHILLMIIGVTTIGRELRDKTFGLWYQTITTPTSAYPNFSQLSDIPPELRLAYFHHQYELTHKDFKTTDNVNQTPFSHLVSETAPIHATKQSLKPSDVPSDPHRDKETVTQNLSQTVTATCPKHISVMALIAGLNGKLIWAVLSYIVWGALAITLSGWVHPASMPAITIVFVAFIAFTMLSLWLGALFSLLSYSLRMGLSSAAFVSAPSFAFAGVTFPLLAMSDGAQRWAHMLPLTHYLKVHISQLQMQAPITLIYPTVIGLIIVALVLLLINTLLSVRALRHPERWGAR